MVVSGSVPQFLSRKQLAEATRQDEELQALKPFLILQKGLPPSLASYRHVLLELNESNDGIVLRGQRIVVPRSLRNVTIDLAHTGHQGIVKTKALVRSQLWFPGIDSLVERKVSRCIHCQANMTKQQFEPLRPSRMPEGPWSVVAGDFFGPMNDGLYWFVNICEYSRWVTVHPIRSLC